MYFKIKLFDYYKVGKNYENLMLCVGYELQCVVQLILVFQDEFFYLWFGGFKLWIGYEIEYCDQGCDFVVNYVDEII